jgi:hypothetical protein
MGNKAYLGDVSLLESATEANSQETAGKDFR